MVGCPIRKSPDYRLFAPTRSLSQLVTSFVASESLGIRRTPLVTFLTYFFYSSVSVKLFLIAFSQYVNELFRSLTFIKTSVSSLICLISAFFARFGGE